MTENSKIPPAKKIIQDPPEYATVPDVANSPGGNVQLEDPAEIPSDGAEAPVSNNANESDDYSLGGSADGAEEAPPKPIGQEGIARNPESGDGVVEVLNKSAGVADPAGQSREKPDDLGPFGSGGINP